MYFCAEDTCDDNNYHKIYRVKRSGVACVDLNDKSARDVTVKKKKKKKRKEHQLKFLQCVHTFLWIEPFFSLRALCRREGGRGGR